MTDLTWTDEQKAYEQWLIYGKKFDENGNQYFDFAELYSVEASLWNLIDWFAYNEDEVISLTRSYLPDPF